MDFNSDNNDLNNDNNDFGDFNRNYDNKPYINNSSVNQEDIIQHEYKSNVVRNDIFDEKPSNIIRTFGNNYAFMPSSQRNAINIVVVIIFIIMAFFVLDTSYKTKLNCSYAKGCSYTGYNILGWETKSKTFYRSNIVRIIHNRTKKYDNQIYLDNNDYFNVSNNIYEKIYDYKYFNKDEIDYEYTDLGSVFTLIILMFLFPLLIGAMCYIAYNFQDNNDPTRRYY
jgi:hypothetical protein